ncbi:MAG: AsmA family protein, partial [Gammaproteobacteria bacterium]|nr:AsmA family protein [Gammaproteobacteria bacterium]
KIMPLLEKRLDIDKLVMHRLVIDFEKNAVGENNWSAFSGSDGVESKYGLAGLVIGGVELADTTISWLDVSADKRFKISKMSLVTVAVVKGKPLPVTLKAYVRSNQPEWQAVVSVKTNLEFNDSTPTFKANNLKVSVKALLPGEEKNTVSFAMVSNSLINFQENTAKLTNTRFSIFGLIFSGTFDVDNIFSVPTIQGPLKVKEFEASKLAEHMKIDIPVLANPKSLKHISLTTMFKTDFNNVYLDDITANIDDSLVKGFVHITDMDQAVVRYDLDVDKIDLHDYATADTTSAKAEIMFPLDLIRSANLEGTFDVKKVMLDDLELSEFHVSSNIKDDIVTANPVTMLIGESEFKAAMVLNARSIPLGEFAVEVKNVDAKASINPLLKNIMGDKTIVLDGIVNANANIKTKGASVARQKKSAKGTVTIDMAKTVIRGIDLNHASRFVVADYANNNNFRTRKSYVPEYEPDRDTEFNSLHASFQVSHGKLINSDLLLVSEDANISGSGSVDFINKKLDYSPVLDINVKSRIDIRDKLRDHPMEYHVFGGFGNLKTIFELDKYELLVGRLLIQESKTRRNKRLNTKKKRLW